MKMYQTVLNANKLGIKKVKANMTGIQVDNICRNYIKDN
jgi:Xaa-Pro aminopeptidase